MSFAYTSIKCDTAFGCEETFETLNIQSAKHAGDDEYRSGPPVFVYIGKIPSEKLSRGISRRRLFTQHSDRKLGAVEHFP